MACAGVLALLLLGACRAKDPNGDKKDPDSGPGTLAAPTLLPDIPTRSPLSTVALRGHVEGQHLVVKWLNASKKEQSQQGTPLPGGEFCVDVPLPPQATTTYNIVSLKDGKVSPPTKHTVTQDSVAPKPANPSCSDDPIGDGGTTKETLCDNDQDDDFDGFFDNCDTDCNGCVEDSYQPNFQPANVPTLSAGAYDLKLCPCHEDWFAFWRKPGSRIGITATYNSAELELRMKGYEPAEAENGGYNDSAKGVSSSDQNGAQVIDWTTPALDAGANKPYYIRVYREGNQETFGDYRLVVE